MADPADADALRQSYQAVPYPSLPVRASHPSLLAANAILHGLLPAPVTSCRVLELGCATGGNLIPMAAGLPGARFVGVDLSPRQIDEARELAGAVGAGNLTWLACDLLDLDDHDLGQFDYIICHGIYSWVPPPVQQAILALCQRHLAPHGIAYISYNTYPGFHARQPVRDMMLFHTRGLPPAEAAPAARRLLEVLRASVGDPDATWARVLRDEADKIAGTPDAYLVHEHLEPENRPCYFHEFMAAASAHGLGFLCEAERLATFADLPDSFQALAPGRSQIDQEQYFDFLCNRALRASLLCRSDAGVGERVAEPDPRALFALCAAFPLDDPSGEVVRYRSHSGEFTLEDAAMRALLGHLYQRYPQASPVAELPALAAGAVSRAWSAGLCDLHAHAPPVVGVVSVRPTASPVARVLATRQATLPNQWHQPHELDAFTRELVTRLDGRKNLGPRTPQVKAALQHLAANGFLCA
ncbi:MAG: class I SAM-dependent methyltransferase [Deltaproteobacteria bacterium]|nr:class I SAM-dependent methyltransferase [Deltaproteobacteria bacterium]